MNAKNGAGRPVVVALHLFFVLCVDFSRRARKSVKNAALLQFFVGVIHYELSFFLSLFAAP